MLTSRATVTIAIHVISRSVKEFLVSQNYGLIERLISVLGRDFALSESPNMRKGGLIGLAAAALGLQKVGIYFPQLVQDADVTLGKIFRRPRGSPRT